MKFKTLVIYGHRVVNGVTQSKIFKQLHQAEKWVGTYDGTIQAMSFRHGDQVEYRYIYRKGRRISFNNRIWNKR